MSPEATSVHIHISAISLDMQAEEDGWSSPYCKRGIFYGAHVEWFPLKFASVSPFLVQGYFNTIGILILEQKGLIRLHSCEQIDLVITITNELRCKCFTEHTLIYIFSSSTSSRVQQQSIFNSYARIDVVTLTGRFLVSAFSQDDSDMSASIIAASLRATRTVYLHHCMLRNLQLYSPWFIRQLESEYAYKQYAIHRLSSPMTLILHPNWTRA